MAEPVQSKKPTKPFKEFPNRHKRQILTNVMKTIELATQNQPEQFFEYLLESPVGKTMILPKVYEQKVKPIMKNISGHFETAAQVHKLSILSMVANHFSLEELVSFGFPIGRSQLGTARAKDKKQIRSTNPVKKPNRSSSRIPDSILVKIIQVCLENSKKSRAKKVYPSIVEHLDIPGYETKKNYDLTKTKSDIYLAFKTMYPQYKVCQTTFYKYFPQNFIAPRALYKLPIKKPENQNQLVNLNQADDTPARSNSNYSNSVSDVVIPPLPVSPNYLNSVSAMEATSLPSNANNSNSVNTIGASSLPSNPSRSNSNSNMITPHPPYNSHCPNTASNMRAPPLQSNPNYSNSTSNMGASSFLPNPNYSNSNTDTTIPFEPSRFYR